MTKDEALKLALEALYGFIPYLPIKQDKEQCAKYDSAITAIKQALAAPVQEPVAWPCVIAEADFEKNTVTLEMQCSDYKVGAGRHWLHTTPPKQPAPVQEPVHQWRQKHSPYWYDGYPDNDDGGGPYETRTLYTTLPTQPAPVPQGSIQHLKTMMEESAWEGGLDLSDALANIDEFYATAQPAPVQEPVACHICGGQGFIEFDALPEREKNNGKWGRCLNCQPYTTPPATQRQWFGLAETDKHKPNMGAYVYLNDDWLDGYKTGMEYAEAKLKEKNNG